MKKKAELRTTTHKLKEAQSAAEEYSKFTGFARIFKNDCDRYIVEGNQRNPHYWEKLFAEYRDGRVFAQQPTN